MASGQHLEGSQLDPTVEDTLMSDNLTQSSAWNKAKLLHSFVMWQTKQSCGRRDRRKTSFNQ